jgi:Zn-dependent peptidase ImmA (M78 family)
VRSSKIKKIEGPLHHIKVKFVSPRTIERAIGAVKEESCRGCYFPDENLIYVNNAISEEEQLFVLWHEVSHAIEFQLSSQEEETRVDSLARYLISLMKLKSLKDVRWL